MDETSILCICGHMEIDHGPIYAWCIPSCKCTNYRQDNLKYLENIYKSKGKK